MKRILHIIAQKPSDTGSGIFLQNIVRAADKKGYEQAIIAGISAQDGDYSFNTKKEISFYPVVFESDELPYPVVGMSDVMPYVSTRYSDMNYNMLCQFMKVFEKAMENAAQSFKPQIIISHHLWLVTALAVDIFRDCPIIAICHGTDIRQLNGIFNYRDYIIEKIRKIPFIISLSPYQKKEIQRIYGVSGDRIFVTGGGYNEDIFYPLRDKPPQDSIKIVYAGKLSFAKGVDSLIRALNYLPYEKEELTLVLVGDSNGKEKEEIMKLVDKCPYAVELKGRVSQKELGEVFRQCSIFIMPSFYEGLSLVTIEALASGLLVVSNDLPGMREWIGESFNNRGIVRYVKMPRLKSIDRPYESQLPDYEIRLGQGIMEQIKKAKDDKGMSSIWADEIRERFSWDYVFSKVEDLFPKIYR